MLETIFEFFFDKVGGKIILAVSMVAGLIGWFAYDQRAIGARDVIAKTNQSAAVLAAKGADARLRADSPGSVDRLRKHSCRDC